MLSFAFDVWDTSSDDSDDNETESTDGIDVEGTDEDDVIQGTSFNDIISGLGGSDIVSGLADDDTISAVDDISDLGTGDLVDGGFGMDTIYADSGDTVTGGAGADTIVAYQGAQDGVVTVTDFDPAEDTLELVLEGPLPTDITVDVADVDGGGVMYSYDGVDIAFIENVTAEQMETANISFADAPTEDFPELDTLEDVALAAAGSNASTDEEEDDTPETGSGVITPG